jgi:hypothetical protein
MTGAATVHRTAVLLLALSLVGTGCRGAPEAGDPDLVLDLAISPTPPAVGAARLIITLRDTAGVALDGAEILVEGNMSHAGMAPVRATAEAEGDGRYSVQDFRFTMAGGWVLTTHATLPDGRWARTETVTQVVAPPPGMSPDTAGDGTSGSAPRDEPGS